MKKKQDKIKVLLEDIDTIIQKTAKLTNQYKKELKRVHPRFEKLAENLIHYRALRTLDVRALQKKLGNLGLSRFGRSHGHVLASLKTNRWILKSLKGDEGQLPRFNLSFKKSDQLARRNVKDLLGYRSKGRYTRIMVTLPTAAADDYQLVHAMISNGMNCARINCAHDGPKEWKKMIDHVRKASAKLNRKCKVAMDLGGPKIRTGTLLPGPKVQKFRPVKDVRGRVVEPFEVWMGNSAPEDTAIPFLPVNWKEQPVLQPGDYLYCKDARMKKREFVVVGSYSNGYLVHGFKTTYVETGMPLYLDSKRSASVLEIGDLPPVELPLVLYKGDYLRLHKSTDPGEPASNEKASKNGMAHISCTLPDVFKQLKTSETIFFDDGKIESVIRKVNEEEAILQIVQARDSGSKLRSDKGINFVSSDLRLSGLTKKDKKDLEFVVKHADVVNFSFVDNAKDVRDLIEELNRLDAPKGLGIILKIETQNGYNRLTEILLEAMRFYPVGVMIARGDLAIEVGWTNIGRVQGEILALCRAAGIPTIWATQVLENLSKQGIPSRAEITDAAMAQQADAVMLNKGPYILKSIQLLDTILKDMSHYQEKNAPMMPKMEKADIHEKKSKKSKGK